MFGAVAWVVLMTGSGVSLLVDRVPLARLAVVDFAAIALPAMALALVAAVIGWVELLEPRLTRRDGAVEFRAIEPDRLGLRSLLADLLATPRVDVAYTVGDRWIDANGRAVAIDRDRRRRTLVRVEGETVAAILHDRDVPVDAVQLGRASLPPSWRRSAPPPSRGREPRRCAPRPPSSCGRATEPRCPSPRTCSPVRYPNSTRWPAACVPSRTPLRSAAEDLRTVTAHVREISHGLLPRDLEDLGLEMLGSRVAVARRLPSSVEVTVYLLAYDDPDAVVTDTGTTIVVNRTRAPSAEGAARTEALGGRVDGTVATVPVG